MGCYRTLASDSYKVDSGVPRGGQMPLFPYFPVIVWVGMIKVMLDMTDDDDALGINDSTGPSANSASIVLFPTPLACAVVLR